MRHQTTVPYTENDMAEYKVVETFVSINGEGRKAGELAFFLRLKGCNLDCSYCDTKWANKGDASFEIMDENEIYGLIKKSGIRNVTITGGEPLFRKDMAILLEILDNDKELSVEIETNGSVDLKPYLPVCKNISFTMDYKLPTSRMEEQMCLGNFEILRNIDTVKFVSGSIKDLEKAEKIIQKYDLCKRTKVYISPVFGNIDPADIVEFMKERKMNKVRLQLQLHKFIWDPDKRGV